jgi:hypothetical protein
MKEIKRHIFTGIFMFLVLSGAYAQTSVERSQLVGTWQQVDSLGNPLMAGKDFCEYKIITPETFSVVQVVKSKGYFISVFFGTYNLENDTYIENITYANPGAIKLLGTKNLFYFALKNNLMYVSGMNNPYKQIWKKIDKLPEAVVTPPQTDTPTLLKKTEAANVKIAGGDGLTIENAVIITAKSETTGIAAEYDFIGSKYGARNVAWQVLSQAVQNKKSKIYDVITIKLAKNDEKLDVYFDITNFYGKF